MIDGALLLQAQQWDIRCRPRWQQLVRVRSCCCHRLPTPRTLCSVSCCAKPRCCRHYSVKKKWTAFVIILSTDIVDSIIAAAQPCADNRQDNIGSSTLVVALCSGGRSFLYTTHGAVRVNRSTLPPTTATSNLFSSSSSCSGNPSLNKTLLPDMSDGSELISYQNDERRMSQ